MKLLYLTESALIVGWAKATQAEFNALLKRYGAKDAPRARRDTALSASTLSIDRGILLSPTPPDSLDLPRDKRAHGLLRAIARWLIEQVQAGRGVDVAYWGVPIGSARATIKPSDSLQQVVDVLMESTRLKDAIEQQPETEGYDSRLCLDLRFRITRPSTSA